MARSEQVAAAVALKEAGYDVDAEPTGRACRGRRVRRAGGEGAQGRRRHRRARSASRCARPRTSARRSTPSHPGETVTLVVRRNGDRAHTFASRRCARRPIRRAPSSGSSISQAADDQAAPQGQDRPRQGRRPVGGASIRARGAAESSGRDVDHGRRVVATGEIELDGTVAPIGGVKQKVFGARKAGADVFLVPAGDNATEARRYAGNLRIVPVESFQQALSVSAYNSSKITLLQVFCPTRETHANCG